MYSPEQLAADLALLRDPATGAALDAFVLGDRGRRPVAGGHLVEDLVDELDGPAPPGVVPGFLP